MSETFSLIDCYIAPMLYRMQESGIKFSGAGSKAIKTYMDRVFERPCFIASLKSGPVRILEK